MSDKSQGRGRGSILTHLTSLVLSTTSVLQRDSAKAIFLGRYSLLRRSWAGIKKKQRVQISKTRKRGGGEA